MPISSLTDIPEAKVPDEVRGFIQMGAQRLRVMKQPNGLWSVLDEGTPVKPKAAIRKRGKRALIGNFYADVIAKDPRFSRPERVADIALLEPTTRKAVENILADAAKQGEKLMLFETFRSRARQKELFERGATKLQNVGVHHYGLAADLVRDDGGAPSWKGDFSFLGELARKHGLVSGIDWGRPDEPHSFVDPVHVQRVALGRQHDLFAGLWYPDGSYDPYV
jgi:hypothetical protein